MRALLLAVLALPSIALAGCDWFDPDSLRGCTDSAALNADFHAEEDDGSCVYSRVIFYKAVSGPPVEVTVDGQPVGTITAFYPSGPGNCSAPGNATFQLQDGQPHDWNAQSAPFLSSGTVRALRSNGCVRVRVF